MRLLFFIIILFISFTVLSGEEVDSLDSIEKESIEMSEKVDDAATNPEADLFIDEDGDGIADNRNFRERMKTWRRTRAMSERMLSPGSGNSENSGKFGNKAKKGGQEGNNGNNQGNGGNGNG